MELAIKIVIGLIVYAAVVLVIARFCGFNRLGDEG